MCAFLLILVDSACAPETAFEAISLCGANLALFEQSLVTFDELVENPEILLNASPDAIVVKMNGKLVPWPAALPQLLSNTFFKRPLPTQVFQRLVDQYVKKDDTSGHESTASSSSGKDGNRKGYSWFPWRRSQNSANQENPNDDELPSSPESLKGKETATTVESSEGVVGKARKNLSASLDDPKMHSVTSSSDESEGGGGREDKEANRSQPLGTQISVTSTSNAEKYKKTLRLTTEQLVRKISCFFIKVNIIL